MKNQKTIISILVLIFIILTAVIAESYFLSKVNEKSNGSPEEIVLNPDMLPVIQNLFSDYIRENISDLSSKPEVLGGSYYITTISFIEPYIAIVDYEDGHIANKARVEFAVSENGQVDIKAFEILPEEENKNKINFQESGNIVAKDGSWQLVYEEPGKPALTMDLIFDENIKEFWQNGDRVEVQGIEDQGSVLVVNISESQGSLCEDKCGNGVCDEIVCLGEGCPCAETASSCPIDCK